MRFCIIILCRKKLSPEEVKAWQSKLIGYANYVNIVDDVIVLIHQIVLAKVPDSNVQKAILASLGGVSAGLMAVYNEFKNAYDQVTKDKVIPSFTGDIPFPPPPPTIPDKGSAVSWFQLAWNAIQSALDVAAQKSPKINAILVPLIKAGNELVAELEKYFGGLKFPSKPKSSTVIRGK